MPQQQYLPCHEPTSSEDEVLLEQIKLSRWKLRKDAWKAFITEVYLRFREDHVALAAGAIAFFTILSLFPLILLAISFSAAEFYRQLSTLSNTLEKPLIILLQQQILSAVNYRGISTAVALFFGLWSGSQIFLILESAMNLAWRVRHKRPFWLRRGLSLIMLLIVGSLLVGAVILVNTVRFIVHLRVPLWGHRVTEVPLLTNTLLTVIIPVLLISILFAIVYRVLPSKRITLRAVLPGAFFAGALWLVSLHAFSWYTTYAFERYHLLYGSFVGLVFLLLWFYYSALIMLLGAEISAVYHRRLLMTGDKEERMFEEADE